jgi:hypothetical protein
MIQSKKPNTTAMRKKARKRPYKKGGKKSVVRLIMSK